MGRLGVRGFGWLAGFGVMWGSAACAQVNSLLYELRIVSIGPNGVSRGFVCSDSPVSLAFALQGRVTANSLAAGNENYGVMRAHGDTLGQTPSFITVTDAVSSMRLTRGVVDAAGPGGFALTGRASRFRSGGPVRDTTASAWHSAGDNGLGGAAFPSGAGNQFGAFDQNGDRLYGFDAFAGATRSGEVNPWTGDFPVTPVGQATAWVSLYHFNVELQNARSERSLTIHAVAFLRAGLGTGEVFGSWPMRYDTGRLVTAAPFSVQFCPSPGAAMVLGLGAKVALRRRRTGGESTVIACRDSGCGGSTSGLMV